MQFRVTVDVTDQSGVSVWGYDHAEVFVGTEDAQLNALDLGVKVLERIDEARVSLSEQIGVDAPLLASEQASQKDRPERGQRPRQGRRHG